MTPSESTFEARLRTTAPATWRVQHVVVFGWSDGPEEGVCALADPKGCFYFTLVAESAATANDGARLFRIDELPITTLEELLRHLSDLGPPRMPVWVPRWQWDDYERQQLAEQRIAQLLARRRATAIMVQTTDMKHFQACWIRVGA